MYLRNLELKDVPLMLEWMHDDIIVHDLQTNFASKTICDCESFIKASVNTNNNLHFAIATDEDEYMGTVSLKHIDYEQSNAEFAITVRKCAMGRGYSWYAMETIIKKAFDKYGLNCVYWCVSQKNARAVRFYDKHHYHEAINISPMIKERYGNVSDLKWYSITKEDIKKRKDIIGCKVIRINTIAAIDAGELSFFESNKSIPFNIKRIYYISKVPEGMKRGFHAHKNLKQLIFCPFGKILLTLDDTKVKDEIILDNPSVGVLIERSIWREMLWLQKDSVLCIAASEYYDADDYIRDYGKFQNYIESKEYK